MKLRIVPVFFALLLAALPISASASVWYVSTSGYDDPDNGHSWGEPFASIQYAASRAQPGDEIWVAEGQYSSSGATISCNGVSIYGGFNGESSKDLRRRSVYSGIDGSGSSPVFYASGSFTFDGLYISGGGTGVYCTSGSAVLTNGIFSGCGTGLYCSTGSAVITNNLFTGCGTSSTYGGGIYFSGSSITITGNTFTSNAATNGAGIYIAAYASTATITYNSIVNNSSQSGGAIYSNSSVQMSWNTITGNSASDNYSGGNVQLMAGGTVRDNIICANTGNGLFANGSTITVENNTIKSNSTVGMKLRSCISSIKNNIFTSNYYGIYMDGGTVQAATYNDSYGNTRPNIGITLNSTNLTGNPQLTSDYHLQSGSCCIDAGTTTGSTTDIDGEARGYNNATDIGADEYVTATPATPSVTDDGAYTSVSNQLHATWTTTDPARSVVEYQYAIGTTSGGTDVVSWTSAGTGLGVTRTSLSLTSGSTYYFSVKSKNHAGIWSQPGASDGITVDTSAPSSPTVSDSGLLTAPHSSLSVSWSAATDAESGISGYRYAVGTSPGLTDVLGWSPSTPVSGLQATITGLSLLSEHIYYVSVKAVNNAGLWGNAGTSDGVTVVDQLVSYSIPSDTVSTSFANGTGCTYTLDDRGRLRKVEYKRPDGVRRQRKLDSLAG